jgi:hypothetical protein
MIYLDVNNKVNIKKNKVKLNIQNIWIERRIGRRRKVSNKQKQQKTTWTGVSKRFEYFPGYSKQNFTGILQRNLDSEVKM